ncbi:MAG: DHH family phosphoesterase [Christensenellales bacterium]|jgi:phosphoesterase RecJ-like protein
MSQDIRSFLELLQSSKSIAIISHQVPDVDAFASVLAFKELIRKFHSKDEFGNTLRKRIHMFLDYTTLPESTKIFFQNPDEKISNLNPDKPLKKYDLTIALDCANIDRLGNKKEIFERGKVKVNLDHHLTNTKFADLNYVYKTSSTCEALYYIFIYKQKVEVSKFLLSLLYAGILTDTNNLQNNADTHLTSKAVTVIKHKLGKTLANKIKANFFQNSSQARDELYSYAYSKRHRKYYVDGKLCLIDLDYKVFNASKAQLEDAEGIVDEALYRKGVIISAIMLEKEKGKIFVKIRARQGIDVSVVAKHFNGGGHAQQAAFQYEGKMQHLMKAFIKEIEKFIDIIDNDDFDGCPELFD